MPRKSGGKRTYRTDFKKLERELKKQSKYSKEKQQTLKEEMIHFESNTREYFDDVIISDFCKLCEELQCNYDYSESEVERLDKLQQDLLHLIEFSTDYKERYKISTQLHNLRVSRRNNKDICEELKPLISFLSKDENKKFIHSLKSALGEVRSIRNKQKQRVYNPRCMEIGEFYGTGK